MLKVCRYCNKDKDINDFYRIRANSEKREAICKNCKRIRKYQGRREYCYYCGKEIEISRKKFCSEECRKSRNKQQKRESRKRIGKEVTNKQNRKTYKKHGKKWKKTRRKWYLNNKDDVLKKCRKWQLNNLGKTTHYTAKYRATKRKQTPKWLTQFDYDYMNFIYIQAKQLEKLDGIKRHVDHIVPLQGKSVSGLHVPWNLQILTEEENLRKGNKL